MFLSEMFIFLGALVWILLGALIVLCIVFFISAKDAKEIKNWNTQGVLEKHYKKADDGEHSDLGIKYSDERKGYIVYDDKSKTKYESCNSELELAENYACVHLTYCFHDKKSDEKKTPSHSEHFNDVIKAVLKSPADFFVPTEYVKQYSDQELVLLETFRSKLCAAMDITPKYEIIDRYDFDEAAIEKEKAEEAEKEQQREADTEESEKIAEEVISEVEQAQVEEAEEAEDKEEAEEAEAKEETEEIEAKEETDRESDEKENNDSDNEEVIVVEEIDDNDETDENDDTDEGDESDAGDEDDGADSTKEVVAKSETDTIAIEEENDVNELNDDIDETITESTESDEKAEDSEEKIDGESLDGENTVEVVEVSDNENVVEEVIELVEEAIEIQEVEELARETIEISEETIETAQVAETTIEHKIDAIVEGAIENDKAESTEEQTVITVSEGEEVKDEK